MCLPKPVDTAGLLRETLPEAILLGTLERVREATPVSLQVSGIDISKEHVDIHPLASATR